MTYILYFAMSMLLLFAYGKAGAGQPSDHIMLILAILTAGEVVSWRMRK